MCTCVKVKILSVCLSNLFWDEGTKQRAFYMETDILQAVIQYWHYCGDFWHLTSWLWLHQSQYIIVQHVINSAAYSSWGVQLIKWAQLYNVLCGSGGALWSLWNPGLCLKNWWQVYNKISLQWNMLLGCINENVCYIEFLGQSGVIIWQMFCCNLGKMWWTILMVYLSTKYCKKLLIRVWDN